MYTRIVLKIKNYTTPKNFEHYQRLNLEHNIPAANFNGAFIRTARIVENYRTSYNNKIIAVAFAGGEAWA